MYVYISYYLNILFSYYLKKRAPLSRMQSSGALANYVPFLVHILARHLARHLGLIVVRHLAHYAALICRYFVILRT